VCFSGESTFLPPSVSCATIAAGLQEACACAWLMAMAQAAQRLGLYRVFWQALGWQALGNSICRVYWLRTGWFGCL
jgi:hypothetical protein